MAKATALTSAATRATRSPYLTPQHAFSLLGVTCQTIYRWVPSGRLRGTKLGPRAWRVERTSVAALLPAGVLPAAGPEHVPLHLKRVLALLPDLDREGRRRVMLRCLELGDPDSP